LGEVINSKEDKTGLGKGSPTGGRVELLSRYFHRKNENKKGSFYFPPNATTMAVGVAVWVM
jgi:hypothetical protein